MEKSAVIFEKNTDFVYHLHDNTYGVKILVKKDDVESIEVFVNDKYINSKGKLEKAGASFSLKNKYHTLTHDVFIGEFTFDGVVMSIFFKITDKLGEVTYYGSYRFYDEFLYGIGQMFDIVPYLLMKKTSIIPSWSKGALMYQIFSERYAPTDTPSSNWNEPLNGGMVSTNGTLKGIESKLDYIKDLGVDVVYLTPIFLSKTNHRYDTDDYYKIDPRLGSEEDLLSLVNKVHSLGMHFVMDLVFNHTSIDFFAFKDILINQEKSKYRDWYVIESYPVVGPSKVTYKCFSRVGEMPKLNTSNLEVQEYLLGVTKYYVEKFHLDGIRIDVADEIDLSLLRRMHDLVKSINKDIMIYGELWFDAANYLQGDIFDSVMNYQFFNYAYEFLDGKLNSNDFGAYIDHMYSRFHIDMQDSILNILSSHDTDRITFHLKNDKKMIKAALTLLFLVKGSSMLYYGEENALTTVGYTDNRNGMNFNSDPFITPIVKKLGEIKKISAFKDGEYEKVDTNNDKVFSFIRYNEEESYRVIINLADKEYKLDKSYEDYITGEQTSSISSKDACVIKIK